MNNSFCFNLTKFLPDSIYLRFRFFQRMGHWPHLNNPRTLSEKLQWLKLYDRNPKYVSMVDKVEAKKYVAEIIGNQNVVPTYGIYESVDEIDFDSLPNQFVLKCTHDSGGIFICKDKLLFDKELIKIQLRKSLRKNYYWRNREWPYLNMKPRILAEKYLGELVDYKFYCFNGSPKFLYVSKGLDNHKTANISFLTLDWQFAPFKRNDFASFTSLPPKPTMFNEMIRIAKKLSQGIPFVRVDLYQIADIVYFSELTFFPCGGVMHLEPEEWDAKIGEWLDLPQK